MYNVPEILNRYCHPPHQLGGEGGLELSQGQQQLLCLARMILRRAPLVLLDEASASVDAATAAVMREVLAKELGFGQGPAAATVVEIAHDLRAITGCDRVVVMAGGVVVEEGKPQELIGRQGSKFGQMLANAH